MLGMVHFMRTSIDFKWSIVVPNGNNLLKVCWEKRRNRTSLLILIRMAKLMGEKPDSALPMTHINSVTKSHADHIWTEESSFECCLLQLWVFRHRKLGDFSDTNKLWAHHSDTSCDGKQSVI